MAELEIPEGSGVLYRTGRLNGKQQLHLATKLLPLVAGAGPLMQTVLKVLETSGIAEVEGGAATDTPPSIEDLLRDAGPFCQALAGMDEKDVDAIVDSCLAVVHCKRPDSAVWAPVMPQKGMLMFQDMEMTTMLQLCFEVIRENLLNFLPARLAPGNQRPGPRLASG